jgi:hypothetical protein
MSTGPWEGGKGSRPRKYNVSKYLDNYDRIFGNAKEPEANEELGDKLLQSVKEMKAELAKKRHD